MKKESTYFFHIWTSTYDFQLRKKGVAQRKKKRGGEKSELINERHVSFAVEIRLSRFHVTFFKEEGRKHVGNTRSFPRSWPLATARLTGAEGPATMEHRGRAYRTRGVHRRPI